MLPDYTVRIVLLGDGGVGKTSLAKRFVDDEFETSFMPTIGMDYTEKLLQLTDNKTMKLQIWDTAGQERFQSVCQTFLRNAQAAILVFDLNCVASFANIRHWISKLQEVSMHKDIPMVLVGNKSDLTHTRFCVMENEAKALAQQHTMEFVETSAKLGTNADRPFLHLAELWLQAVNEREQSSLGIDRWSTIRLQERDADSASGGSSEGRRKCHAGSRCG